MTYFKTVVFVVVNIIVFGILTPFLVSYPDTFLVSTGFLICLVVFYFDCKIIHKKNLKEK